MEKMLIIQIYFSRNYEHLSILSILRASLLFIIPRLLFSFPMTSTMIIERVIMEVDPDTETDDSDDELVPPPLVRQNAGIFSSLIPRRSVEVAHCRYDIMKRIWASTPGAQLIHARHIHRQMILPLLHYISPDVVNNVVCSYINNTLHDMDFPIYGCSPESMWYYFYCASCKELTNYNELDGMQPPMCLRCNPWNFLGNETKRYAGLYQHWEYAHNQSDIIRFYPKAQNFVWFVCTGGCSKRTRAMPIFEDIKKTYTFPIFDDTHNTNLWQHHDIKCLLCYQNEAYGLQPPRTRTILAIWNGFVLYLDKFRTTLPEFIAMKRCVGCDDHNESPFGLIEHFIVASWYKPEWDCELTDYSMHYGPTKERVLQINSDNRIAFY